MTLNDKDKPKMGLREARSWIHLFQKKPELSCLAYAQTYTSLSAGATLGHTLMDNICRPTGQPGAHC